MKWLPYLFAEAVGLGGVGLVVYGAWRIYPPAAFILLGLVFAGWATLASDRWSPRKH